MKTTTIFSILVVLLCTLSCGKAKKESVCNTTEKELLENVLTMQINGANFPNTTWTSEPEKVFGSFHPYGYNDALIIAGTVGKGATQQEFTLNMYKIPGVGTYTFSSDTEKDLSTDKKVIQLAGLSTKQYLYGGIHNAYSVQINVTKATTNPEVIEATFSGKMQGMEDDELTITNGKFYYHE